MTHASDPANLRQHKRLRERIEVEFRLLGTSAAIKDMKYMPAQTRDISAGGVFIELLDKHITKQNQSVVDDFLLFKSEIDMQIKLPTRQTPIPAKGKAVWIEKETPGQEYRHGVAISFTNIEPSDKDFIDQFVMSRI
jgi:c-di-GMP-binding flagellar brake protein YcgR